MSDFSPSSTSSSPDTGAVIAIVLIVIAVLGVTYMIFYNCYMALRSKIIVLHSDPPGMNQTVSSFKIKLATVELFLDNLEKEKPIRFLPEQLQYYTSNYSKRLGSGGFGSVYEGVLPNGVRIAVKVLQENLEKKVLEQQFMAEVGTIGRTYHINLVRLYGFCFDVRVRALVYEFMENGALDTYLFNQNHSIDWGLLHEIAIGTAKGIRYLHEECQHRIIHYDIKPGNILLDAQFNPKVADFGLAKLLNRDRTHASTAGGRGTPGYAAPEMWMPYPVTYKCDVYSFGMLLFEIVGRRRNLDLTMTESQEWFPRLVYDKFENGNFDQLVSICGIEDEHKEKAERMCKVALWCVQYSPEARPPMSKVVKMLEGEMVIKPPMNPFQHLSGYFTAYTDTWNEDDSGSAEATGVDSVSAEITGIDSGSAGATGMDLAKANGSNATTIMRKYEIEIATSK